VVGPVSQQVVQELIQRNRLIATDSVCAVGATHWLPVARTQFAQSLPAYRTSPAAYSCPRCAAPMVTVLKSSAAGWVLFVLGILTTVIFIGIVLIIIGAAMLRSKTVAWHCPQCGYAT
jgi:predicted RNA-binding Zn-ribbon protein involved in translation (DUF1610 family)